MEWWGWVLIGWAVASVLVAVPLGRALRVADRLERGLPLDPRPVRRRHGVPVPAIAVPLAIVAVALEAVGFALRVSGQERSGDLLSMDQPGSVPRLYVTAVFVAAAGAAFLGAARNERRRPWWLAVGVVTALVAEVGAGGTVRAGVPGVSGVGDSPLLATAGSALVAGAVIAALWWLSRGERRDRRRVLAALGSYAAVSVGLGGVSAVLERHAPASVWVAVATFVEESGAAVAAVAVLMAVLVGVTPRLVLPATWSLRRTADAETVDAPSPNPRWLPGGGPMR